MQIINTEGPLTTQLFDQSLLESGEGSLVRLVSLQGGEDLEAQGFHWSFTHMTSIFQPDWRRGRGPSWRWDPAHRGPPAHTWKAAILIRLVKTLTRFHLKAASTWPYTFLSFRYSGSTSTTPEKVCFYFQRHSSQETCTFCHHYFFIVNLAHKSSALSWFRPAMSLTCLSWTNMAIRRSRW